MDPGQCSRRKRESGKTGPSVRTVETWLIWKLTKGAVHVTDYSNASRTMLFNINTLQWDDEILANSTSRKSMPGTQTFSCIYGEADPSFLGGPDPDRRCGRRPAVRFVPDRHVSHRVKQRIHTEPDASLLMNTGEKPVFSKNGLVTTIAWGLDGKVEYAPKDQSS